MEKFLNRVIVFVLAAALMAQSGVPALAGELEEEVMFDYEDILEDVQEESAGEEYLSSGEWEEAVSPNDDSYSEDEWIEELIEDEHPDMEALETEVPETEAPETELALSDEVEETDLLELVQEETVELYAASSVKLNASEVTIYALDPNMSQISIPSDFPESFQIVVSGTTSKPTFSVTGRKSIEVSDSGLVTPKLKTKKYTTIPTGEITIVDEYDFETSTVTVTVDGQSYPVKIHLENYAVLYAKKRMDDFLAANITPSMSDMEKVRTICEWLSRSFDYGKYPSYVSMMVRGEGDCWANTDAVNYMCGKLGIEAYDRIASNDPGAGSGHRNSIVVIDGENYIVDCGYQGTAPRYYKLEKMKHAYSYRVLSDGTAKITQYEGFDPDAVVPAVIDGYTVSMIGNLAFGNGMVSITSVTLPDTITTLEDNAFFYCRDLTSVTIPASVTSIGRSVFATTGESKLTAINVAPENPSFTSRDGVLFDRSGETLLAFPGGKSGSYTIPSGTRIIDEHAFYTASKVTSVTFPSTVTTIRKGAFESCYALRTVSLASGLKIIGDNAFRHSNKLHFVTIPASVTAVGKEAFYASASRIRFLGADTELGTNFAVGTYTILAGPAGSPAQAYAAANDPTFVAVDNQGNVPLDPDWFADFAYEYPYCGTAYTPTVYKAADAPYLYTDPENADYTVTYENNVNAGTASAVITGTGFFAGSVVVKHFTIKGYASPSANVPDEKPASPSTDVSENVSDPRDTEAAADVGAASGKAGSSARPQTAAKKSISLTLAKTAYTYTGKAIQPSVTVKSGNTRLSSAYYSVSYKNNKNAGIATVTVTGKGIYAGCRATAVFEICPKKTTISSVKSSGKRAVRVVWKKNAQAAGYQIQYSTSSSFKNAKSVTVKGASKTSATLKKLTQKKKYYVRIRAYQTSGGKKLYGAWSKTKKVKVK